MDWSSIAKDVAKAAPLVGTLLGGPAGGAVGGLISSALGVENKPDAVASAIKADPQALVKIKQIELDHKADLERMHLQAETTRLSEINKTMRTEAASNDGYVRRWRPTFGYLTAVSWAVQSGAIAWSIIADPGKAGDVAQMVTALTPMWGIALTVLGVSVHKRSQDKQTAAGVTSGGGALSSIVKAIKG